MIPNLASANHAGGRRVSNDFQSGVYRAREHGANRNVNMRKELDTGWFIFLGSMRSLQEIRFCAEASIKDVYFLSLSLLMVMKSFPQELL